MGERLSLRCRQSRTGLVELGGDELLEPRIDLTGCAQRSH